MIKELTDKLIVVILPEEAENIRCHTHFKIVSYLIKDEDYEIKIPLKCIRVGTITKSRDFDFDCEKYVDKVNGANDGIYRNYQIITMVDAFDSATKSFLSLLKSKGILLERLNNEKILILEKI